MATQSLYRRYRPRRFAEVRGQDHVVRALRDAVATGREGQAYLFSGPRGTGKTTTARILAKVLNCDDVADGEPCCECDSCLAVEQGTSYDVHELDAASNRGIDAMRDLIEKASLGTAGRHKVYILDEVHMLTKEAAAALLKTLEEPPPHVVFVLATTDPQKVIDTIRSRTQHLHFHLLPTDTLADHVQWVADDAGFELSQAALDAALVRGGGSARDTLSALEVLVSSGGELDEVVDLDEFLDALIEHDSGRALTAMGHAVSLGRDPRTVTEDLVRHLRNAFLALMAPELVVLPREQVDAIGERARRFGAAALVRAIEQLGSILVEMRHAPDPRILVEVALVQLTHDAVADDTDALVARIGRLERQVKELAEHRPAAAAAAPTDPATGRAVLGGAAKRGAAPTAAPPATASEPATAPHEVVAATAPTEPAAAASMSVPDAWESTVKSQLKPLVRALYSAGSFAGERGGGVWRFDVPNEAHAAKCADHKAAVEAALSSAVGSPVTLEFVSGGRSTVADAPAAAPPPTPAHAPEPAPGAEPAAVPEPAPVPAEPEPPAATGAEPYVPPPDDEVDLSELTDAPPETVKTPIDRLAEAFPGSELMPDP